MKQENLDEGNLDTTLLEINMRTDRQTDVSRRVAPDPGSGPESLSALRNLLTNKKPLHIFIYPRIRIQ